MKYLSIIKYVLLVASFVLVIFGATTYDSLAASNGALDTMLVWAAVMLILTAALALAMPLVGIAQNPKSATKTLMGLGVLAVIVLVSYALSSVEPLLMTNGKIVDNVAELRFSDMALYTTYIMFGVLLLSMIVTEVYKSVKN